MKTTNKINTNRELSRELTEREFLPRATRTAGGLDPQLHTSSTRLQARPACAHPFLVGGITSSHQNWMELTEIYERGLI